MPRLVELYYDIACPFSYLTSYAIRALLRNKDIRVLWKPISIGKSQSNDLQAEQTLLLIKVIRLLTWKQSWLL